MKKKEAFSDQVRRIIKKAIKNEEFSKYRIYTDAGVNHMQFNKFLEGGGARMSTIDRIAEVVGIKAVRVDEDGEIIE